MLQSLKDQGAEVAARTKRPGSPFLQSGIVILDLALRVGDKPLILEPVDHGQLRGFDGTRLIAHDISFNENTIV